MGRTGATIAALVLVLAGLTVSTPTAIAMLAIQLVYQQVENNVLSVPVTALLAQATGRYEVELAGPRGARRWVPVTTGIFDDADGLVQVTGALTRGERVVVPAT